MSKNDEEAMITEMLLRDLNKVNKNNLTQKWLMFKCIYFEGQGGSERDNLR